MKRLEIIKFGAIALFGGLIGFPASAADTITIGDMNAYTRLAAIAGPYKKGLDLGIKEINAAGGVLGKKLVIVSRDTQGKPGVAIKIAEEMISRDGAVMLVGTTFSHVGIALSGFAKQNKVVYLASGPLADAISWSKGNAYTFRLRSNVYMLASMLVDEAVKKNAKRWATIAPNFAYGKEAVSAFKKVLKARQPDVEFVAEQWPAAFKIEAGAEVQAIENAKPDAIFNATFGSDLAKFAREGRLRGLFKDRYVTSLLTGEPEYIEPLKGDAPENWYVTGYPWYDIDTADHNPFQEAYNKEYNDYPRLNSVIGYTTAYSVKAAIEKAGSTDSEKLRQAMEGLKLKSPLGPIVFREIDNQSTLGMFVGWTKLKDGKGIMIEGSYRDGANFTPTDEEVRKMRPAD
ncbi:MAG: ABC transporter substrate-binding protein [Rhodospirillales bacterium]|nr:ABC transporter substrate-binding protein [Rhodospirillales bacterium]